MAGVKSNELIAHDGFQKGINNVDKEESSPKGTLRAASNIDIDNMGKLSRRQGFSLSANMPGAHSVWAHENYDVMCLIHGGNLVSLDSTLSLIDQVGLQRPLAKMSYTLANGRAYYSNRTDIGMLDAVGGSMNWPIVCPGGQPMLAVSSGVGGLEAGTYQVAVTFIDFDGVESGSSMASLIDVEKGDGITLSSIPQSTTNIQFIRIYRTTHNGDVLYFAMDIPIGLTTMLLAHQDLGKQLETQFLSSLPAGQIIRYWNGRILVAVDNVLYWSESFNFGLTHLSQNYVAFNDKITLLETVGHGDTSGIYIAAGERTYYMSGSDPKNWQRSVVTPYAAVPDASCMVDAKLLGLDTTGLVPVWLSSDGALIAGIINGVIVRLHDKHYAGKENVETGAMAVRDINGISQLITTMLGGAAGRMVATDRVEFEVWKDGKRIS